MFALALILLGLVVLVAGAEFVVRGASQMATAFGVSSLLVGLTVVAFGTSAPELAVSISSALTGKADIAVGNVVGSNIYNVLFILGLSALVTPLVVAQKLVRFDVPVMIAVSIIMWLFSIDGIVGQVDGALLVVGLLAFTWWCIVVGRRESAAIQHEYDEALRLVAPEITSSPPTPHRVKQLLWQLLLIVVGLVLLIAGAHWLVEGATDLARRFGISELMIGLTIVAGGTSLPELATSIVAAMRGERDIAVGNVVGSNIFNILGVLGLTAVIVPGGIAVPEQVLTFDIPVMVAVAVACLPLFFTGHLIARWEGGLFFGYCIAYTVAISLIATQSSVMPRFKLLMLGFIIPLTVVTIGVVVVRELRGQSDDQANEAEPDDLTDPPSHSVSSVKSVERDSNPE